MELELGFLSEAERKAILEVLKRDEDLRQQESTRVKRLQKDLRLLKRKGVKKSKGRTCARCQKGLGLVINSGEPCRQCRHVVCNECRVLAAPPNKAWKCTVCHKEAVYKVETGEWFVEEKTKRFGSKVEPLTEIVRKSMKKRPGSKRDAPVDSSKRIRDQVESGTSPNKLAGIPEEGYVKDDDFSDAVSNASTMDSRPECSRQASRASHTSERSHPAPRSHPSRGPSPVPSYVSVPASDSSVRSAARHRRRAADDAAPASRASSRRGPTPGEGPRRTPAATPAASERGVSRASSGGKLSKSADEEEDEIEEGDEEEEEEEGGGAGRPQRRQRRQDEMGDEVGDEVDYTEEEEEEGRSSVDAMFRKCSKKPMDSGGWTSEIDLRSPSRTSSGMGSRCTSVPAVNRVRGIEEDEEEEEEDIDRIITSHRSSAGASGTMRSTVSMMSLMSTYSEVDFGGVEVRGDVLISLQYEFRTGSLNVNIRKARNLAYGNEKKQSCNPYVKIYLLPDKSKQSKRKTAVQKGTINPIFNETLKYTISQSQLSTRTLQLSVWHRDTFGRNAFLGETEVNMDTWNLENTNEQWMPLQQKSKAQPGGIPQYKGELTLSVKFVPEHLLVHEKPAVESRLKRSLRRKQEVAPLPGGEIHLLLREAHNLCPVKPGGTVSAFIKASLLPIDPKLPRMKTSVVKQTVNPVWNETLVLRGLPASELRQRGVEITVWDRESIASKHFLGGVRLGMGPTAAGDPVTADWMDAQGEEVSIWHSMCSIHNVWAEACLLLRPDMARQ